MGIAGKAAGLPRKVSSNKDCRAGSGGQGKLLAQLSLFPAEWLLATYASAPLPGTGVLCHSFCWECFSFSPCPECVQAPRPARTGPLSCLPQARGGGACKDRSIAVHPDPGHFCPQGSRLRSVAVSSGPALKWDDVVELGWGQAVRTGCLCSHRSLT